MEDIVRLMLAILSQGASVLIVQELDTLEFQDLEHALVFGPDSAGIHMPAVEHYVLEATSS